MSDFDKYMKGIYENDDSSFASNMIRALYKEVDRLGKLIATESIKTHANEDNAFTYYSRNLRMYFNPSNKHASDTTENYIKWLERKLYDNDVPVRG